MVTTVWANAKPEVRASTATATVFSFMGFKLQYLIE
jgi:hypothetical protein